MKYVCPFCYKKMPEGYEPSGWSCCGEVGHATILPECPKCGAENIDLPIGGLQLEHELANASDAVKVALERAMNDDAEITDLRTRVQRLSEQLRQSLPWYVNAEIREQSRALLRELECEESANG